MAKFARFNEIVDEFRDFADFVIIYIEEAHATDGWRFDRNFDIRQHRTLDERFKAARILLDFDPRCPILVDKMTGDANRLYGALPERLFIILNDIVVFESKIGPWGYKTEEVYDWLKRNFRR